MAVEELLFMFILVNDITKLILQDKELSHEKYIKRYVATQKNTI